MKTFLLLAFAIMWIADTLFTTHFVLNHGVELEANPVMHYVIKEYGLLVFMFLKATVLGAWGGLFQYTKVWHHVIVLLPTTYAAVLGGLIVFNS